MNLEVVNWKQLMKNKHDTVLEEGLGYILPSDANPSQIYSGSAFIKVLAPRTQVKNGESLKLKVIAMGVLNPSLKYRGLGATIWNSISLTNVGRSVYEVTIPVQSDDYEYFIESGIIKYPVLANNTLPTYNTVIVKTMNNEVLGQELQGIEEIHSVYPNPTNGIVTITLEEQKRNNVSVEIFDISGKLVFNKEFKDVEGQLEVDIRELSNNLYIIRIYNKEKNILVRKLIKN